MNKPLYVKRIEVCEGPRPYESDYDVVSRYFDPFETQEEAEKYSVPRMFTKGDVFPMWPPDNVGKESGAENC